MRNCGNQMGASFSALDVMLVGGGLGSHPRCLRLETGGGCPRRLELCSMEEKEHVIFADGGGACYSMTKLPAIFVAVGCAILCLLPPPLPASQEAVILVAGGGACCHMMRRQLLLLLMAALVVG